MCCSISILDRYVVVRSCMRACVSEWNISVAFYENTKTEEKTHKLKHKSGNGISAMRQMGLWKKLSDCKTVRSPLNYLFPMHDRWFLRTNPLCHAFEIDTKSTVFSSTRYCMSMQRPITKNSRFICSR